MTACRPFLVVARIGALMAEPPAEHWLPAGLLVEERLGTLFPNGLLHPSRHPIKVLLEQSDVRVNFAVAETSPM